MLLGQPTSRALMKGVHLPLYKRDKRWILFVVLCERLWTKGIGRCTRHGEMGRDLIYYTSIPTFGNHLEGSCLFFSFYFVIFIFPKFCNSLCFINITKFNIFFTISEKVSILRKMFNFLITVHTFGKCSVFKKCSIFYQNF